MDYALKAGFDEYNAGVEKALAKFIDVEGVIVFLLAINPLLFSFASTVAIYPFFIFLQAPLLRVICLLSYYEQAYMHNHSS